MVPPPVLDLCKPLYPQEAQAEEAEAGAEEGEEGPPDDAPGPSGRSGRRGRDGGDGGVFGVKVTDIWNDSLAEQLGLQPARSRKKQRARERWRWGPCGLGLAIHALSPTLLFPPAAAHLPPARGHAHAVAFHEPLACTHTAGAPGSAPSPPRSPCAPCRKKSAAKGKRRRELPEEVTSRLGEANMLYATGKNHKAIAKLMEASRAGGRLLGHH